MNPQKILLGDIELSIVEIEFDMQPLPIEEIVECEDGSETQYYVGIKNLFNISFSMLPANGVNTLDLKAGRNELKAEYDKHTSLAMVLYDEDGAISNYTVRFVTNSYKEKRLRPLTGDKDWRYNISFSLKET
ncbi:MAG TPA: hypothetical protein VMV86_00555 [Methanosarcinales archaeon]|nr:hypothetical protein [Methanosarcinales archaeon]